MVCVLGDPSDILGAECGSASPGVFYALFQPDYEILSRSGFCFSGVDAALLRAVLLDGVGDGNQYASGTGKQAFADADSTVSYSAEEY